MKTIMRKCSFLLLVLAVMFCFLLVAGQDAYADEEEILISGVENILSGLNGNGQIVVGRDVTFDYADLMNLHADLRVVMAGDEEAVVGIRKSTGEEYALTPGQGGIYSFSAPEEERLLNIWYKVTVTIPSTGKVYVANMPVYVSSFRIYTLTTQTEGQGTVNVAGLDQIAENIYEYSDGDLVDITTTPAEGWYFDRFVTQGLLTLVPRTEHTYAPSGGDVIVKAVFKEYVTTGSCGENATYSFDTQTGILTISGTGAIARDAFNNDGISTWDAVTGVVIGEGITEIGENAFIYCRNMTSASLPAGVRNIGIRSFNNCRALTEINIPSGVEIIGEGAFSNCAFSEILLPDGLTYIGVAAFAYNEALQTITIPESVTSIGSNQFNSCNSLKSAVVKANISSLPLAAFQSCKRLETVSLPDSLTTIEAYAFSYTESLESIELPENLTTLENNVFQQATGLKNIRIPDGVTEIPRYAFTGCTSLQSIVLPDNLTTIGASAFASCQSLSAVTLPAGLTSLDSGAFASCRNLSSVSLPAGLTEISDQCFSGDVALTSISIPDAVTKIGYQAFNNTGLTSITFPNSLTSIGSYAFENVKLGSTLTIPANVSRIETRAFYNTEVPTIVNNSAVTIPVSDIRGVYLDENGEETDTIGQGTYTRKVTETPDVDTCPSGGEHDWQPVYHKATFTDAGYQSMKCSKCGVAFPDGVAIGGMPVTTAKLAKASYTYTGKAIKPAVTLASSDGPLSKEYYTLTYSNNTKVGTASVKITLKGDYYEGTKTLKFKINKAANPLTIKAKTATVKYSSLKKKNQTLAVTKVISFTKKGQGQMTYAKASGIKKITISKTTGKVTVKKGLKKGTYKVKVKVKAAGNANFKASTVKTVTFKVQVK